MDPVVFETLWRAVALYLPARAPSPKGGRPRVPDRDCLRGILFVLREGIRWRSLPQEMGCGSGSTCYRHFRQWTALGLWPQVHTHLVAALGRRGLRNLERAVVDSASARAQAGGPHTGPNPTDRAKAGCKRHLLTDACGIPLVVWIGPANRRDEQAVPALLWLLWAVLGGAGARRRVGALQGDRGYGFPWTIVLVLAWGLRALLAPRARRTAAAWGARALSLSAPIAGSGASGACAMLRAGAGALPGAAAVGGLRHLRPAAPPRSAARRRVPALRPGRLGF